MRLTIIIVVSFLLDQITKLLVKKTMYLGQSIEVFGDVVRLTYVENPGMAFGINIGNGTVYTILTIVAIIGIVYYMWFYLKQDIKMKSALALVLGGAFGNLIDRILYARVVDFIDIGIKNTRWPVFNIADSVVVIGMILLSVHMFFLDKPDKEEEQKEEIESA